LGEGFWFFVTFVQGNARARLTARVKVISFSKRKKEFKLKNEEASEWFKVAALGDMCLPDPPTRCPACEPSGICDPCGTVYGRFMEVVNEYASTCDWCADLTMHDQMRMDPVTQLGYCKKCVPKLPADIRARLEQDSAMSNPDQESR
jgi:hypothetical protein